MHILQQESVQLMTVEEINKAIQELPEQEREKVSDGYHTFLDLYAHRILLWIKFCHRIYIYSDGDHPVWRSKVHSDGSSIEGWFILGMYHDSGQQITYHLPDRVWHFTSFAETLLRAPQWDGHTSNDVLKRLEKL